MNLSNLGNSIKLNRERMNLTQEKLADLLDVSPHYIYELEKCGKTPSLPTIIKIAEVFHISIDSLLSDHNEPEVLYNSDQLSELLNSLSANKRNNLYKVLCNLLPYLKL